MSKAIRDSICFTLLFSEEGPERCLNRSDAKVKPITSGSAAFSLAFSRFLSKFNCFYSGFLLVFSYLLIGCCNYLVGVLWHSIEKHSNALF